MKCKDCEYCECSGRTTKQYNMNYSRKIYHCRHPLIYEKKDKMGFQLNNFIEYGNMSKESPLQLKTRKRFCPETEKSGKYD